MHDCIWLILSKLFELRFQIIFRKYGWAKASFIYPHYRYLTQKYNFDDYSSKGSTVHPVKKYNRLTGGVYPAIEGSSSDGKGNRSCWLGLTLNSAVVKFQLHCLWYVTMFHCYVILGYVHNEVLTRCAAWGIGWAMTISWLIHLKDWHELVSVKSIMKVKRKK